jgi:hypothetical protein
MKDSSLFSNLPFLIFIPRQKLHLFSTFYFFKHSRTEKMTKIEGFEICSDSTPSLLLQTTNQ